MTFLTLTLSPAFDRTLHVSGQFSPGGVHRIQSESCMPGGKGINVARVMARNGCDVIAGGILGANDAAQFENHLSLQGVRSDFMRVEHPVRHNLMITDDAGNESKLNRPGYPDLSLNWDTLTSYTAPLIEGVDVVLLSGSLPETFPDDTYARLITTIASAGRRCVLDTSGPALNNAVAAGADVLKPNRSELAQLCGHAIESEEELLQQARTLAASRLVVIVSDGANGAYFVTRERAMHATSPKVNAVDSTGAGDTLLGQFCADVLDDDPIRITELAVTRAVAAGAACVEQKGPGAPDQDRLTTLAKDVQVRTL